MMSRNVVNMGMSHKSMSISSFSNHPMEDWSKDLSGTYGQ